MKIRLSECVPGPLLSLAAALALVATVGCGNGPDREVGGAGDAPNLLTVFDSLPAAIQQALSPWQGDLPGMVERRVVRVLTPYEPQYFGFDGRRSVGTVADGAVRLESYLNDRLGSGAQQVSVLVVPVSRDLLLPFLESGRGDIVAGGIPITAERLARVDFADPVAGGVSAIVVTGGAVSGPASIDDLGSLELHVRPSSSYWEDLQQLDRRLREGGNDLLNLVPAAEFLDDADLLELVSNGIIPATVVYDYHAELWSQVFPNLVPREDLAVSSDVSFAWAVRKGSPALLEALNEFGRELRQGSRMGNIVIQQNLVQSNRAEAARRFKTAPALSDFREFFQRYGAEYDLDWVLLAAQAYQESQFDPTAESHAGAVGIMQIKPSTAKEVGVEDISTPEANIKAGAAYIRHLVDNYFDDPGLTDTERQTFATAGYNAGPSRIQNLRQKTAEAGLDPDEWFDNVEILVAREVGSETTTYVANVTKYHVMFTLMLKAQDLRESSDN